MYGFDYDGHCGSCVNYSFKGDNRKGYCSKFRAYYYPDDTCRYQKNKSGSVGCYLTTACCEYKNLPDDCYELETLRHVRDKYIKEKFYGEEMINYYYKDAPIIIEKINKHPNKNEIYEEIYHNITDAVKLIENGEIDEAIIRYLFMVYKLKRNL